MRIVSEALLSLVLMTTAFVASGQAIDWKAFDDPQAFVRTGSFANEVRDLPEKEKAAAIQRLHDSLKSPEVEVRRRAALTLGALGDRGGVPTMIEDLSKATGSDRDNVVVALRILNDKRAVPALRKALKDKSPYVRGIAASALGEMQATKAYEDLVVLTEDKIFENVNGTLNCVRQSPAHSACYALGALGDRRAVPVLIELLDDEDLSNSSQQALKELTKQDFGEDAAKWKAWWKTQQK